MGADGLGSSVMFALAALLWLAYFVPTWLRRREYLATERNAVRLQQTLRVLAETAEVPEQVRAETSARNAAEQERILRKRQQRAAAVTEAQEAAIARAAARRLAERQPAVAADVVITSSASRRLRRSRAVTSAILLVSLVTTGVGIGQLHAFGSSALLAAGSLAALGCFAMLGRMASVGRARAQLARTIRQRPPVVVTAPPKPVVAAPERPTVQSTWTPVQVPKPLYLSRPAVDRAVAASLEAAAELRQAAADAERRLRDAQRDAEITPIRAATKTADSRFASMGIVDSQPNARTDLDAVLRRRRAAAS
jgi:hypothetical protein